MTEDVGTTPRKPLTPAQRLKLFEAHKGICYRCTRKIIGEKWIDEHIRPLGLGGSNDLPNRRPVHLECAAVKTRTEDMPAITKAKAQKRRNLGIKPASVQEIESPGFPVYEKPSKIAQAKIAKTPLPPRAMFK